MKLFFLLVLLTASCVIAIHGLGDLPMYYAISAFTSQHRLDLIYGINPGVGRFFYGPVSLVLFYPMHYFSYAWVKAFWIALNAVAFFAFWSGLGRLFPFLEERKFSLGWLFIWVFSIKSIHASFQSLNVQLLFGTLFIWAEIWRRSSRSAPRWAAGITPSILTCLKLYPSFLCAYYFLIGSKQVRWGLVSGVALCGIAPFLFFGWNEGLGLHSHFYQNLSGFHDAAPLTTDAVTLSLPSLIATYTAPWMGLPLAIVLIKACVISLSGLCFFFLYRTRDSRGERFETHRWAFVLAMMTFINSTTRPDYFVFFIPALCGLVEVWRKETVPLWFGPGVFISVALIAFIAEWILGSRDLGHQLELLRFPVIGMAGLCALTYFVVQQKARQARV